MTKNQNSKPLMSPKIDFVFKLIFGDSKHKEITIAFLTAVLNLPPGVLADIEIINSELLREYKEVKKGILDSAGQDARRASDQHRDSDIADGVLELPKLFEEGITVSNDDAIVQWMLFIDGKSKEVMEMLAALTIPSFIAFR